MLILIAMETMTQCRVSTMRGVRLISSDCRRLTHYYFSNLDKNLFFLLYSWWFSYFFFGITFSSTFFPSIWMSIQFFCINNMPTCCTSILFTQNLLLIQISHTHTHVTSDEMLESENSSMAERLYDLERQVLEQQEEILSLKSTLAEVLRRLNILDCNSSRISTSTSSSSSYETTIKNNRSE